MVNELKENKTFLPVDSILYPQDKDTAFKGEKSKKLRRRATINHEAISSVPGLRDYSASGQQVYHIMNEKNSSGAQQQFTSFYDQSLYG